MSYHRHYQISMCSSKSDVLSSFVDESSPIPSDFSFLQLCSWSHCHWHTVCIKWSWTLLLQGFWRRLWWLIIKPNLLDAPCCLLLGLPENNVVDCITDLDGFVSRLQCYNFWRIAKLVFRIHSQYWISIVETLLFLGPCRSGDARDTKN